MRHTPAPFLALGASLAVICLTPSAAALAVEPDSLTVESSEHEALITALDALGLSLDDPELQDLDNGELWAVIEAHAGREGAEVVKPQPQQDSNPQSDFLKIHSKMVKDAWDLARKFSADQEPKTKRRPKPKE